MEALGSLRGARAAKTRTLALLGTDIDIGIGDRLLQEVQNLDPDVRRTAPPGQGVFFVAVPYVENAENAENGPRRVLMQRSFQNTRRDSTFQLRSRG